MRETMKEAVNTQIEWGYLDDVQGVVLLGRSGGEPIAMVELCPRSGFRLTDCASGRTAVFQSLEDAKVAASVHQRELVEGQSQIDKPGGDFADR